jgi:LPXTG-motif cell wall-anchored protein
MVNIYAKGKKSWDDKDDEEFTQLYGSVVLSDTNSWKYTWKKLPRTKYVDGCTYSYDIYYVSEEVPTGYNAVYTDKNGDAIAVESLSVETSASTAASVDGDNALTSAESTVTKTEVEVANANSGDVTITNSNAYKLPESGGIGYGLFTFGALAMMIAALLMYILKKRVENV